MLIRSAAALITAQALFVPAGVMALPTSSAEQQMLRGNLHRILNASQVFRSPQIKGVNVDYCLHYNVTVTGQGKEVWRSRDCGQGAADAYCKSQGFASADPRGWDIIYYSHDATYVQGDNRVYEKDDNMGHGSHSYFNSITCITPST